MRELVEITWEHDEQPADGNTVYVKEKYFLLHFGLRHEIIDRGDGTVAVANYTVAICQHYKTGQLEMFDPRQIRVLDTELKK